MTNNEDLALKLKSAAEMATPGKWERGDGKHGGELLVYCDDALGSAVCEATSTYNSIPKLQRISNLTFIATANPANILALLADRDAGKKLIAELDQRVLDYAGIATARAQHVFNLEKLIAELEARTVSVKLPDCDYSAVQHMSGGSSDYCNGFIDGTQNAIKRFKADLGAAGIKLEVGE